MSEPKRQHPVAAITRVLALIRENLLTIIILLFVGSGGGSARFFYFILAGIFIFAVMGVVSWLRFTYQVVDGELRIKQGIFVRKNLYLSQNRIQVIDISAGILQRLFGLVSVEVKTAGSTSKEAKIDAVTRSEAQQLKQLLRKTDQPADEEEQIRETVKNVYHLDLKDLAVAASTSGNLGIALSIVAGAFSQIDQVVDEQQMIDFFEWLVPASVGTNLVVLMILLILVVSWVFSFLGSFIKYYDFTLTVKDDELFIRRGLFEQKQLTIPFNRIQAIRIKEELLRQPFGYASIILESAGYGEEQLNSTTLFPLIKREKLGTFIQEVIPDYHVSMEATKPPKIALRRYMLRMVWLALFIIIPAWLFIPFGVYSLFLLVPALMLGYAQYRDARLGVADTHTMMIQSRLLSRTTAIVKKYRVQSAELAQNPFQRRLGLVSYQVTVISGSGGQTFGIRELNKPDGTQFLEWISDSARLSEKRHESDSFPASTADTDIDT